MSMKSRSNVYDVCVKSCVFLSAGDKATRFVAWIANRYFGIARFSFTTFIMCDIFVSLAKIYPALISKSRCVLHIQSKIRIQLISEMSAISARSFSSTLFT